MSKQAEEFKNKGNEALQKNNLDEALKCYTQSINLDPKLSASYCNRALIYLKKQLFQNALEDCDKALKLDPNYVRALHRRGKAYEGLGKLNESIQDYKNVISNQPDNNEARQDLKNAEDKLAYQKKANKRNLKTINNLPLDQIQEEKERIGVLINEGKFPEAQQDIVELLRILKDQDDQIKLSLWSNLILCYMQVDEPSRVVEQANLIIDHPAANEQLLVKTLLRRALAFEKLDKNKRAVADYQRVKELSPGNLQAAQGLNRLKEFLPNYTKPEPPKKKGLDLKELEQVKLEGNSLFKSQQYQEAISKFQYVVVQIEQSNIFENKQSNDYSEAITLYTQVLTNSALCYYNQKCHKEAVEVADKVLNYDPTNFKALYRRGVSTYEISQMVKDSLARKQYLDKSRKDLETVCYLDPQNAQAKAILDQVNQQLAANKR